MWTQRARGALRGGEGAPHRQGHPRAGRRSGSQARPTMPRPPVILVLDHLSFGQDSTATSDLLAAPRGFLDFEAGGEPQGPLGLQQEIHRTGLASPGQWLSLSSLWPPFGTTCL